MITATEYIDLMADFSFQLTISLKGTLDALGSKSGIATGIPMDDLTFSSRI